MQTLVVASGNKGKIKEIKQILGGLFEVKSMAELGLNPEIEESGSTFEENAAIKALELHRMINMPVLADDSGLCVHALGGNPGVLSARYSDEKTDEANNAKLLANMQGRADRRASFVSAVALVKSENEVIIARGETFGVILDEAKGREGFGYDPLFLSDDLNKTFGEASAEEKNLVSHRFRALQNLLKILEASKKD